MIPDCRAWGVCPDLPYPRNSPSKLLTDVVKGPHEEVLWAVSSLQAIGLSHLV